MVTKNKIAHIQKLANDRTYRCEMQSFLLEGNKVISESLTEKGWVQELIVDARTRHNKKELQNILSLGKQQGISCLEASSTDFRKMTCLKTHQGLIAILKMPIYDLDSILKKDHFCLCIADNIQDPTNAGILIRTALAFKIDALIFTQGSIDVFSPKVVRASSGTLLRLPIVTKNLDTIHALKKQHILFYASDAHSGKALSSIAPSQKSAIVFGNEGQGITKEMQDLCDHFITIPISPRVESLNINSAAAIILHYFSTLERRSK